MLAVLRRVQSSGAWRGAAVCALQRPLGGGDESRHKTSAQVAALAAAAALAGTAAELEGEEVVPGEYRAELPTLTWEFVRAQKSAPVLTVYKRGVYDVSEFSKQHPGGPQILLAAGGSIGPFWNLFKAHHHADVYAMLEELRVGNLSEEDAAKAEELSSVVGSSEGAYADDPARNPLLVVNSKEPFNAETPRSLLTATFETPNELFFVRNHLPVPSLTEAEASDDAYHLELESFDGSKKLSVSLAELKTKFAKHEVTATIQCAGNRRSEMNVVKPVKGLSWGEGAISTARWAGARLDDVLKAYGLDDDDDSEKPLQVQFEALDSGPDGERYGASIALDAALDPRRDVLLAWEMGGEPLPRDHGFPLRLIVPGVVGARNVKYLKKIVVADEESPSFWQRRDYKGFPPNVDFTTPDAWEKFAGPAIQELPVTSAVTGTVVDDDVLTVRGYAWSGGGRAVVRVDVSFDDGKTWQPAHLDDTKSQPLRRAWAWTPWQLTVDLADVPDGDLQLRCKAVDDSYNSQPESVAPIWNMRGVLNNAWHRSTVSVRRQPREEPGEKTAT